MKKEKTPSIVSLAILSLITSILWIFFSLYQVFTKKTDVQIPAEILESFSPNLDEKTISEIEKRVFIEQNQIPDSIPIQETLPEETKEESPSPELEDTEQTIEDQPVENETDNGNIDELLEGI